MRSLLLAAALAVSMPAANAASWISVCLNKDVQYTQTIGGPGFFHVAIGGGRYDTQKLVQSHYDGNMVCAVPDPKAPKAQFGMAEVCANKSAGKILLLLHADKGVKVKPDNAETYCKASVRVYDEK